MTPLALQPALAELRRRLPRLAAAYLFGSAARGEARADSDLDLGVLGAAGPIDPQQLQEARFELEALLSRDVDLVDLAIASPILAREVLLDGRRFDLEEPTAADFWEVRALREYEDLKFRRAGIEADIRARGRVYPR